MQAMIALVKREYLEHRGAFVFGPLILLGLMLFAAVYVTWSNHVQADLSADLPSALRFYEAAFVLLTVGWWCYLLVMLFFYFADAFSSDSRNNSMLFWKSMPRSDFTILSSKMLSAYTVFPTAILLAVAVTGVIAYLPAFTAGNILPGYVPPSPLDAVGAFLNILAIAVVFFAIGLLWYAPFFAWVGLLSTFFRRWAIPLAVLIPAIVGMFETMVTRGLQRPGSHVLNYLGERAQLDFDGLDLEMIWFLGEPWHAPELITRMLVGTDWVSLVGGLVVAVLLVFAASEYRRRYVLT